MLVDVALGRTSCSRFAANQFRVLLAVAAYVLLQTVRRASARTTLAHAQVHTLRERLLNLGALVGLSVRRLTLRLPGHAPWRQAWCTIARAPGGVPL